MYDYTSLSSWTIVASAIILIGATYLLPERQPTTLRPFTTDQTSERPLFPDSVQARLWQDPIEAGWQRIRSLRPIDKEKTENIPHKLWAEWEKAPCAFQSRIGDSELKSVFYLPIVLSGKSYPESREQRLRSRFALQEAMETLEYKPRNFDKLMYFPIPLLPKGEGEYGPPDDLECINPDDLECINPDDCKKCLTQDDYIPVTYEIFKYDGKNKGSWGYLCDATQNPKKLSGNLLEIMRPFMDGKILLKVAFVDAAKRAQKIAYSRP